MTNPTIYFDAEIKVHIPFERINHSAPAIVQGRKFKRKRMTLSVRWCVSKTVVRAVLPSSPQSRWERYIGRWLRTGINEKIFYTTLHLPNRAAQHAADGVAGTRCTCVEDVPTAHATIVTWP